MTTLVTSERRGRRLVRLRTWVLHVWVGTSCKFFVTRLSTIVVYPSCCICNLFLLTSMTACSTISIAVWLKILPEEVGMCFFVCSYMLVSGSITRHAQIFYFNFITDVAICLISNPGIEDLRSGKIVTPLPPKETFLDDPLRVLRAIRFGIAVDTFIFMLHFL